MSKKQQKPAKSPKSKEENLIDGTVLNGTFYTSSGECGGDCSRIQLRPFLRIRLLNITPAPPAGKRDEATITSNIAKFDFLRQFVQTIRELNRQGNAVGLIIGMFLDGFGGDEICKSYSPQCECLPNMSNPFELWTRTFQFPVQFTLDGVDYVSTYESTMEMRTINATCSTLV